MSDLFQIIPYKVRSAGTDVPPEEIQTAINSLAQQTTVALNNVASDPTGPAGGDLGGTYPNPTVVALHVTSGTESGVTVTGNTINSSPIGQSAPAAGAFTTLTATTQMGVTSGGTGQNALSAHNVLLGEGTSPVGFAAPGASGQILASTGASADPSFQTKTALAIASSGANTDITSLNAPALGAATATTAAAHTNTTQVATTAFVETEFASPPTTGIGNVTRVAAHFTTIDATSMVRVIATNTSAQSIPNNTPTVVTGWTSVLNQGAAFVPATGIVTVPTAGQYRVTAQLQYGSASFTSGTLVAVEINQNGVNKYLSSNIIEATITSQFYTSDLSVMLSCAANDTITVSAFQTQGGAVTVGNSAVSNFIMVEQLP